MTPKEKAIELYKKYLEWISNTYYHVGTYSKSDGEKSKECTLIAVNEIISQFINKCCEHQNRTYWEEVKEEVEKIEA